MSTLSFKILKFKTDYQYKKKLKKLLGEKVASHWGKVIELFKKLSWRKCDFQIKNMKNTWIPNTKSKGLLELVIKSYEPFYVFRYLTKFKTLHQLEKRGDIIGEEDLTPWKSTYAMLHNCRKRLKKSLYKRLSHPKSHYSFPKISIKNLDFSKKIKNTWISKWAQEASTKFLARIYER